MNLFLKESLCFHNFCNLSCYSTLYSLLLFISCSRLSRKCQIAIVILDTVSVASVFFMAVISGHITDLILSVVGNSGFFIIVLSLLLKLIIFTLLCFVLSNPLINLKNAVSFISGVNRYQSLTSILRVIKQSTGESLLSFKNLFFAHTWSSTPGTTNMITIRNFINL